MAPLYTLFHAVLALSGAIVLIIADGREIYSEKPRNPPYVDGIYLILHLSIDRMANGYG